ncbi:DUF3678 domain-containing protein [Acidocella sp. MX-AZ03]|uniref:NADH-quinone oxidoreductase subunit B family protein n=1 Tax=Acidocella sp. MX-AZ03 TaxID=2697363 RepID=UPI0022DD9172|nr:DUF3678 domain-containing protein [Acidocella sp. MX-AZ03]WBO61227.1 DUF3678 domain-containing protein [Acidocella sp. MX-AZ03]
MREAVLQARAAMPDPAFVVALGDCAVDGGVFKGSPAVAGGRKRSCQWTSSSRDAHRRRRRLFRGYWRCWRRMGRGFGRWWGR